MDSHIILDTATGASYEIPDIRHDNRVESAIYGFNWLLKRAAQTS